MVQVITPLIEDLSHDEEMSRVSNTLEVLRMCDDDREKVAVLIAYRTCVSREEVYDLELVEERKSFIMENMGREDMASALVYILNEMRCDVDEYEKVTGIAAEREWMRKAVNAKEQGKGSLTFNGKTIYGSLIGHFCKEYGWSFQYVLWGISLVNLKLLMDDEVTTVYLSDEERKKCSVPADRSGVNMTQAEFFEKYKHSFD